MSGESQPSQPQKRQWNWIPLIALILASPAAINYVWGWIWNNQRLDVVAHAFSAPFNPDYTDGLVMLREWQMGLYPPIMDALKSSSSKEVRDNAYQLGSMFSQVVKEKIPNEVPYPSEERIMRLNVTNNSSRMFHKLVVRVDRATLFSEQRNEEKPEILRKDGRIELGDVNPKDHFKIFCWGAVGSSSDYFSVSTEEAQANITFIPDTDYQPTNPIVSVFQFASFMALLYGVALLVGWLAFKFFSKVPAR